MDEQVRDYIVFAAIYGYFFRIALHFEGAWKGSAGME